MQNRFSILSKLLLLFVAVFWSASIFAQVEEPKGEKLKIQHADYATQLPGVPGGNRFMGDVKFRYKETILTCDSVHQMPNNDMTAYSRIHMHQGDTLNLYSKQLSIENESRIAKLRDAIRVTDREMILTTDILDYDMETGVGTYFEGGKIVSTTNENTLESNTGSYFSETEELRFRGDVVLTNPEYTVRADTLRYDLPSETAYFLGPTNITSKDTKIYCENGWYQTQTDICQFNENARVENGENVLFGDSIYFNGKANRGEMFGNVLITDTASTFEVSGEYGNLDFETNESIVTDNALLTQIFETDSLFIHGDTLRSLQDSLGNQILIAYNRVRIFKQDLQGSADSLYFNEADSMLTLFGNPILWSVGNQITGDTIFIFMHEGKMDHLEVRDNSFLISETLDKKYNQIKGRQLTGFFQENELHEILIIGNGQVVYFPTEKRDSTEAVIGMNTAECSEIKIYVDSSEIQKIALLDQPSGKLSPMSKATADEQLLKDFKWLGDARPKSREDLFLKPEEVLEKVEED